MNQSDFKAFSKAWSTCSEVQAGKPLEDRVITFAFDLLTDMDLAEVLQAMTHHCQRSHWMPKPAEIRRLVEGSIPESDVLVELAYAGETILGRYLQELLGGDLRTMHPKQTANRITSKLVTIEAFYRRALKGQYSESEIRMFMASNINPAGRIAPNCPRVRLLYRPDLQRRVAATTLPEQIEQKVEPRTEEELTEGRRELAKLMGGMGIGSIKP